MGYSVIIGKDKLVKPNNLYNYSELIFTIKIKNKIKVVSICVSYNIYNFFVFRNLQTLLAILKYIVNKLL